MKFEEALKAMREGKRVRRTSWDIPTIFYSYANGVGIYDSFKNEEDMIYTKDILAEDWEIVDVWCPLSNLGQDGKDFDLIPADEFLECVKVGGFIDDDGNGYPVIKTKNKTFLYKDQGIYPSEIIDKSKLDFDFVAWFNK